MYGPLTGRVQLVVQRLHRVFRYDAVIVPSTPVKSALETYNIATDRIEVIPNGIYPGQYHRPDIESTPGRLVTVGRLCKRKGHADLLQAFTMIQSSHPKTHLDIVGAGPRRAYLEDLATELGVRENVTFHGFVAEQKKIRLLSTAEVFIFGSHQEGFGIVVLEAMAAGTPVVARELPVYEDFFQSGDHGYLTDSNQQTAHSIINLLNDPALRESMAIAAQEQAREFSWSQTVNETEKLLIDNNT